MTARDVIVYQKKRDELKTIGEFKTLGRELRDKFGLTDIEAIDLLDGRNELEILAKYEKETK